VIRDVTPGAAGVTEELIVIHRGGNPLPGNRALASPPDVTRDRLRSLVSAEQIIGLRRTAQAS
jgi:hypothetical protein